MATIFLGYYVPTPSIITADQANNKSTRGDIPLMLITSRFYYSNG